MYTDEKRYSILAKQLRNYDYVIIDTCSLMDESFPDWMNVFEKAKKEYVDDADADFHAYVPYRCYEELKKHAKSKSKDPELIEKQISAKRALRIVKWAKFRKILEITKKDKEENYADNAITVKVIHDRLDKRILVITQDKGLASDLLYWNHSQSQKGKYVAVYRLVPNGELAPNRGKNVPDREPTKQDNNQPKPKIKASFLRPIKKQKEYDAVAFDRRLKALLTNPNYPLDKKKKDVRSHLDGLATLKEDKKKKLYLTLSEAGLREFLNSGKYQEKPEIKDEKPLVKEQPIQKEEPKEASLESLVKKLRYEDGNSLREAISACASYEDVMFRFHSIPYNPQFHGPVDLTDNDLLSMAKLADKALEGNTLIKVEYKNIVVYVQPRNMTFRVWLDWSKVIHKPTPIVQPQKAPENQKSPAKPEQKPVKPVEKKKEEQPVSSSKKELKAQEPANPKQEKSAKKKEKEKPNKAPAPIASQPAEKPAPASSEPSSPVVKQEPAKKKSKASAKPDTKQKSQEKKAEQSKPQKEKTEKAKPDVKKDAPTPNKKPSKASKAKKDAAPKQQEQVNKEEPKPVVEPSTKTEEPKQPSKKVKAQSNEVKKGSEKAKPSKSSKSKKEAKPVQENPKVDPKPVEEKPKQPQPALKAKKSTSKGKGKMTPFEEAKAFDARLKANISNSNYPVSSKIADLNAQLERVRKLSVEDREKLSFGIDTIKTFLKMLESK